MNDDNENNTFLQASLETYRIALVWNNLGVSLLEQGQYKQASTKFCEALGALQRAFTSSPSTSKTSTTTSQEPNKADKTEHMLDVSGHSSSSSSVSYSSPSSWTEVHTLDETDMAALSAATRYGASSSVFFPIRLEECPSSNEATTTICIARQIAIVLYNRGLGAYIQISSSSLPPTDAKQQRFQATRLAQATKSLQLAHASLTRILLSSSHCHKPEENTSATHKSNHCRVDTNDRALLHLVAMLNLHTLTQVYLEQNQGLQAQQAHRDLQRLETEMERDGTGAFLTWTLNTRGPRQAAAAA